MNTAGQMQPRSPRRRKASIEIYFVLYLSAIILLLGTTPSRHHDEEADLEQAILHLLTPDFRVQVERNALLYSFIPAGIALDTAGANLRRDSMNTITARGSFSSVRFTVVDIHDSSTGEPLPPAAHATLVRRDDRTAIFQWNPSSTDRNAVYRVTVVGTATPLPPVDLKPHLRDRVSDILRRHGTVSDSVTFTVNVFALRDQSMVRRMVLLQTPTLGRDSGLLAANDPLAMLIPGQTPESPMFGQPFELQPTSFIVPTIEGHTWHNRVTVGGNTSFADLDLKFNPPDVKVVSQTPTSIELSGSAPSRGERDVTLTATRRSDGRSVTLTFVVRSSKLPPPDIPRSMFVGQSYRLDFSASDIPSEYIVVEVIENNVSRKERRSVVLYQPSTPGNVRFIRYLDDQQIDDSDAEIIPLPLPNVAQPKGKDGDSEVMVTTVSYGTVGGQPNRCRLHVQEGNAFDPEPVDTRFDDKNKMMTQTWRVRRRDQGEDFWFNIYALDQRGSGSGKSSVVKFLVR